MRFSIIVPTYNRAHFIGRCLDSLLAQSFNDFEVIVVDDGSRDHTADIVQAYSQRDQRIHYVWQPNSERGAARNHGIRLAQGDYITFLDSDDILYPQALWTADRLIHRQRQPEWLSLSYEIRTEDQRLLYRRRACKRNFNKALLTGNHLSCIGVFVRRDIARMHPFPTPRQLAGSEDWVLWLQMAARYPLHCSNEVIGYIVQHSQRSVVQTDARRLIRRIQLCIEHVSADPEISKLGPIDRFRLHAYAYLALHLAIGKYPHMAFYYWKICLRMKPAFIFHKKSLVIIREIAKQFLFEKGNQH